MEPSTSMPSTSPTSPNFSDIDHTSLAECHLVSHTTQHDSESTNANTPRHDSPRSTRRQSREPEPPVAVGSMEHKRRRLEEQGFNEDALAILFNPEAHPSKRHYNRIQTAFLQWCEYHQLDAFNPNPAQLVNYFAFGHLTLKWQLATCLTYKSAILDLFEPNIRELIQSTKPFQDFFDNLKSLNVRSFDKPEFDLQPAIDLIYSWGANSDLSIENLTRKLCFLLAITGFLRYSDLHRINVDKTHVRSSALLRLVIDCPKEKRLGSPIEKVINIHGHPNPILCPIATYQAYLSRVASTACHGPHPTRPSRTINFLIRNLNDFSRSVSTQTISRHVRFLLSKIHLTGGNPNARPLRPRAIGSTNAAINGANVEDILVHGSWASSAVFDNFYRLSRATVTNFTSMALSTSNGQTLDAQSESSTQ